MAQGDIRTGRLGYPIRVICLMIGATLLLASCESTLPDRQESSQAPTITATPTPLPSLEGAPASRQPAQEPAAESLTSPRSDDNAAEPAPPLALPRVIELPGGQFWQGDHSQQGLPDERPVVERHLPPFAITLHEISVAQYEQFIVATGHRRPAHPSGDPAPENTPVVGVSWFDAQAFATWLSRATGRRWRLPSEAEWEYAARAGSYRLFQTGNDPTQLCKAAHVAGCRNDLRSPQPVGTLQANAFGLFDLHGNVWEWTGDCYHRYTELVPSRCTQHVTRGGSFMTPAGEARFSRRLPRDTDATFPDVGFRLVVAL